MSEPRRWMSSHPGPTRERREVVEASAYDTLKLENQKLFEALADIFAMIDKGIIVRDVTRDADPDWHLKAMDVVVRIKKAHQALEGK